MMSILFVVVVINFICTVIVLVVVMRSGQLSRMEDE